MAHRARLRTEPLTGCARAVNGRHRTGSPERCRIQHQTSRPPSALAESEWKTRHPPCTAAGTPRRLLTMRCRVWQHLETVGLWCEPSQPQSGLRGAPHPADNGGGPCDTAIDVTVISADARQYMAQRHVNKDAYGCRRPKPSKLDRRRGQ